MKAHGQQHRSLWPAPDGQALLVIDRRALPHGRVIARLDSLAQVREAIADRWVRGAPLIGASAAYGLALQCLQAADDAALARLVTGLITERGVLAADEATLRATA